MQGAQRAITLGSGQAHLPEIGSITMIVRTYLRRATRSCRPGLP